MISLGAGRSALESVPTSQLVDAWALTVDAFLEPVPGSVEEGLREALASSCRLSRAGLDAGLDVILRGVRSDAALDIFRAASRRRAGAGVAVVILASNLPGLAVQSLLPALALRRPVLVKSSRAEPFFAPAFVAALAERLPAIGASVAARTWRGGDQAVEAPIFAHAGRVVAYGGGPAIDDLRSRVGPGLIAHGPKISLALLGRDAMRQNLESLADALARDIALFDQRGCLSPRAVLTDGDAIAFAKALSTSLERLATVWPIGPSDAVDGAASAVRQMRDEAIMRGLFVATSPIDAGTVVVETEGPLCPSPGRRSVRVYPLARIEDTLGLLEPWRGRLQGVAMAGAQGLEAALSDLGVSRLAAPGDLQSADVATWHNGGLAPLDAFL